MLLVSCKDTSEPKIWIIAADQSKWANLALDYMDWLILTHSGIQQWLGTLGKITWAPSPFDQHNVVFKVIKACYPSREREEESQVQRSCARKLLLQFAASFSCTLLFWLFPLQLCHSEMLTGCQINSLENIRTLHASWFLKRTSSAVLRILQSSI